MKHKTEVKMGASETALLLNDQDIYCKFIKRDALHIPF